jgi:hypothetical protein
MIEDFAKAWFANGAKLRESFANSEPTEYTDIVRMLAKHVLSDCNVDSERIFEVNFGDYQGRIVYILGAKGYQPQKHWVTDVNYGTCSGCDALLQAAEPKDKEERVQNYMTLALHLLQHAKEV